MNAFYLKKRREQLGLAASDIADKTGWNLNYAKSTISRYESGARLLSVEHAELLGPEVLGIPAVWLVKAPAGATNQVLAWYFAELFTPGLSEPDCYIGKDGDVLTFAPETAETIAEWAKLLDNFNAGLIDRFQYETALYNLIKDPASGGLKDTFNKDVCRRVRTIIDIKTASDPELPVRLELENFPVSGFWQDKPQAFSLPDICKIANALTVPTEFLTSQFFFDAEQDLIMFLLHIELTNRQSKSKIVPVSNMTDTSVQVLDPYLKAVLKRIKEERLRLADNTINHIQYINRIYKIPTDC